MTNYLSKQFKAIASKKALSSFTIAMMMIGKAMRANKQDTPEFAQQMENLGESIEALISSTIITTEEERETTKRVMLSAFEEAFKSPEQLLN